MAGYLTRMIARHLGLTEVVQPVLPSRFAPLEEDAVESAAPAGRVEMERDPAPRPSRTDESSIRFRESEGPSAIQGHGDSRLTGTAATRQDDGAEWKKELRQTPLGEGEDTAFLKIPGARGLPTDSRPIEKPMTRYPLGSRETDWPLAPKASPEGKPARSVPDKALSVRPRVSRTVKSEDPGRKPISPTRGHPAAIKADRSEPPVIKVRIGRVEVRAVTPSGPPARRDAPQRRPHLSLEDYLRQREGGRS